LVESLLSRVRGTRADRPSEVRNRTWVFSRESTRVAVTIPVTISGIDEHDRIFREATQTVDVSRRGARIATSNALAVGTYLRIESPSMEKPTVAQVVRYCVRSQPDSAREICVALLDVDETHNIWGIKSPPEDWQTGLGEPTAAQRLGHVLGSEWAARFKSISKVAAPPTGFAMGRESQPKPAPASLKPEVPPSSSEKWPGEDPVSVTSKLEEPVHVSASTLVSSDEGVLSGPDQIRKVPTSDVEERLTGVSLAMETLEGREGALEEDFQGRIEGTLQAFQGKGARQAEDLEKFAHDLGGRWSQQFQEQVDAAVERLREELKNSGRVVEESKQQLAQAFREHAQAMHESADVEVESIKLAAERAVAQLQVAEQKRETSFTAGAGAAQERLTGVSLAVEALEGRVGALVDRVGALVEDFQGRMEETLQAFQGQGARQAKDLERMAQDLGGRWSQQFQEEAEAAAERLREELKNSGQVVEETKQQLASLAEAKLASLSQASREEYGQQLAQAFREHAQAMHEAADEEVESIKLAAEQAIAQLQAAEQKRETSFTAGAGAAEERLTGVSLAVEALEGRVGALVEDFKGKGARQAEDLEKMAQDLGGRWSQQFQEQAEAAVERLREELKSSGQVVEESKRQLASLAEAKLASLSQATREEYGQQLGQAFREHAQAMHEAADEEVESIRLAAEQAIAQLQAAEQKRETSFTGGAGAAEECLTGVSLAVEALEGRVGALVEDFQRRIEGTLQAFQGEGTRQAKDLEKMAQDLGGRWSQQFEEQGKAAVERLREELKNSGRVVEEGKRQLASLAKAKLASLSQATREEYGQQLAQAFREHAQVMHEAADEEVESIKLAAEQAIAQLQAAEEKRETSFTARAGAAEECLTGVSLAVEALEGRLGALVEDFQGRIEGTLQAFQGQGARQAGDLERMAQDLGGRWSQQFEEQAGAAVERLREELKSSGRVVEESKRELASLAKAKLLALSKVADNATAGLEAEQRRLKNQCETSRRELEDLLKRGWTKPASLSLQRGNRPKRRRLVAQPALVAGVCLLIMVPLLSVYLPKAHVMQLQPEAPAEFIDQSPNWSAERRAREEEVAQAYWRAAVVGLQERYPFGSELPAEPPTEFQAENEYIATGGAKAFFETRARYWGNLRRSWVQRQFWVERPGRNTQWAARLRQIWDHLHSHR
jgi:uncharacterized protein YcaQ